MTDTRGESSHRKALRLVAIYRLLLAGPATRQQIIEALGDLYGPNPGRAVRRDLEALAGRPFAHLARPDEPTEPHALPLHHDPATDLISLKTRHALLRLGERDWAALDLAERAFPRGAPHAEDVTRSASCASIASSPKPGASSPASSAPRPVPRG